MKIELEGIVNGYLVMLKTWWSEDTKFYKTEKAAIDAIHRAANRYYKKGRF